MSRNKPTRARWAFRRSWAVSKISWKRPRISYNFRNRGSLRNSPSSFGLSSSDRSLGFRRNSHIQERNSFRWAFDSFALYARVIFFPLAVDRLVELLGHMEAVHYWLGQRQQVSAGGVERLRHIGPVSPHLPPLRFGQLFQAFPGGGLVPPVRHGQHLGTFRVGQVGQEGGVQLVPLLQAQLVDAHVRDHPLRIDLLGLG